MNYFFIDAEVDDPEPAHDISGVKFGIKRAKLINCSVRFPSQIQDISGGPVYEIDVAQANWARYKSPNGGCILVQ